MKQIKENDLAQLCLVKSKIDVFKGYQISFA